VVDPGRAGALDLLALDRGGADQRAATELDRRHRASVLRVILLADQAAAAQRLRDATSVLEGQRWQSMESARLSDGTGHWRDRGVHGNAPSLSRSASLNRQR
jgi:hypothetical protein